MFHRCFVEAKGADSQYDNSHEAPPRVRLVGSMRKYRDCTRILHIELC
jgi:hypothetical protein